MFIAKHWRFLWYLFVVVVLTTYIICNWHTVIDFTPFSNFDGNNLLFIVWLLLLVLPFIRIEFGKVKSGLDTGSNWSETAGAATASNIIAPVSPDKAISELEKKINMVKEGAGNE